MLDTNICQQTLYDSIDDCDWLSHPFAIPLKLPETLIWLQTVSFVCRKEHLDRSSNRGPFYLSQRPVHKALIPTGPKTLDIASASLPGFL